MGKDTEKSTFEDEPLILFPVKIFGVDFSGSEKAGNHIWICAGESDEKKLWIEKCFQAKELPGVAEKRDQAVKALREFVARQQNSIFGMDFPFSIPQTMIREETWEDFVIRFPGNFSTANDFRNYCRSFADETELKRLTDRESRVPFSPYNLRIYRQTYYGIRDLLSPLVQQNYARVLPMQTALSGKPWILEVCPASILKRMNLYLPYKGKGRRETDNRQWILNSIIQIGLVNFEDAKAKTRLLSDTFGDALDSLLAAYIVHVSLREISRLTIINQPEYALEGVVYS